MKKARYLLVNINDFTCRNIVTGQKYKKEVELCNFTADDNSIYYEYPRPDLPENYVLETEHGDVPLLDAIDDSLKNKHFMVICANKNIGGFEPFYYKPTSMYFCVMVAEQIVDFINKYGKEKFTVKPVFGDINLPELSIQNGYEILYFIDSEDDQIRKELNELRLSLSTTRAQQVAMNILNTNFNTWITNNFVTITTSQRDLSYLKVADTFADEVLFNDGRLKPIGKSNIKQISKDIQAAFDKLTKYVDDYTKQLTAILEANPSLEQLATYNSLIEFGQLPGENNEISK